MFDGFPMPTYIALMNWTDQGIRSVKDAVKRAENAKALARKLGGNLDIHYTMGEYDAVAMVEMPSDEAYNRFTLASGSLGNIRTKTLKSWTPEEFKKIIDELP
jgi:uncharacterized protein with GYD domain